MTQENIGPDEMIHIMDQGLAGIKNIAIIIKTYYDCLKEQGFTELEAFTLTRDYQRDIVFGAKPK